MLDLDKQKVVTMVFYFVGSFVIGTILGKAADDSIKLLELKEQVDSLSTLIEKD